MGFLDSIGNYLWNGAKGIANAFGVSTSGYENDEAQKFQAEQAQINREWQETMLDKQMDFTKQMWQDTNEWNSAKSQMDRYREAGLNPYLMMSSGANAGTASSSSSPSGVSTPSVSGGFANTNYTPAGQFLKSLRESKVAEAQERNINADSTIKEANARLADAHAQEILNGLKLDNYAKGTWNRYAADTYDATIRHMEQQDAQIASQIRLNKADEVYKQIINASLPQQLAADLAMKLTNKRYTDNLSTTEGYQQGRILQDIIESSARELNIHLDNQQKAAAMNSIIDILGSDAFWRGWNNFTKGVSDFFGGLGSVQPRKAPKSTHYHGGHYTTIQNNR